MFKDLIEGFVKDQIKNQISEKIGIDLQTEWWDSAIHDVIGSLVWGLANNASKPKGASSLIHALDKDHDGSILDDAMTIMQSEDKWQAIISHILGNKASGISELIGKKNGIDSAQVQKLLAMLAPVVMGYLWKKKNEEWLGVDSIMDLLAGEKKAIAAEESSSVFTAFLDKDGDGDVDMMDLLKMAT